MSALFTSTVEEAGGDRAAAPGGVMPRPFEAYRLLVLDALPASGLPGRDLSARMTSHQLGSSGKLLRPALCLWACAVVGGRAETALPAALAVEWIHNFTLVHDDIQDGDRLRRHRPTVWALWGVEQGINAGDALFARAFEILASARAVQPERCVAAVRILARATRRVIAGQCLDLAQEGLPHTAPAAYLRMARLKTGALLGASLAAGAVLGGGGERRAAVLQRAGELLGLAFQLRDDWLGLWGDVGRTGKPLGDLARRKVTYPVVAAYSAASGHDRDRFSSLFAAHGPEATEQLRDLIEELGGREVGTLSEALADKAVAAVDRLRLPIRTAEFAELAELLAGRTS